MSTRLARFTPSCLEQEWNEPCRTREQSKYINYHNIWGWGRGEGGCVTQQQCLPDLPDSLLVALNKNGMNLVEPESKVSISIIITSGVGERGGRLCNTTTMSTTLVRFTPSCLEQEWNEPCRTREQSKYINYHNIWGWGRGEGGCVTQQQCLPHLPDSLLVALNKNGMNLVEPESKASISIIITSGVGGEGREAV